MTRLMTLVLALAMLLTLSACGSANTDAPNAAPVSDIPGLEDGVFTAKTTVAVSTLGRLLTLGRTQTLYLNVVAGAPAISSVSGAKVTLLKPVAA